METRNKVTISLWEMKPTDSITCICGKVAHWAFSQLPELRVNDKVTVFVCESHFHMGYETAQRLEIPQFMFDEILLKQISKKFQRHG